MDAKALGDHQKLLTDVIKKQIVILGPDITLAKARNVAGLTIADDGTVTNITGDPKVLTQKLVDQFMELSGMIVKKTMEPLLASTMDGQASAPTAAAILSTPPTTAVPASPPPTAPVAPTPPAPTPPSEKSSGTIQNPTSTLANDNKDVQQSEKQG